MRSIFIRLAVVASQKCEVAQNSQKIRTYTSSRSFKVDDFGTNRKRICLTVTLHVLSINSNFCSCTVSEIRRLIGWKWRIFLPLSHSAPPLPMLTLEFCDEVNHEETRVMELLCGERCMILTPTVFDWSTMLSRAENAWNLIFLLYGQWLLTRPIEIWKLLIY